MNIKVFLARGLAALAICWIFFSAGLTAQAHPLSAALADPAGKAHSVKLAQALTAANSDVTDQAFRQLFLDDPNLSKRAFVALLDTMLDLLESDPAAAESTGQSAAILAQLIEQQFGDPKPLQIMTDLAAAKESSVIELIGYINSQRPATAETLGTTPGMYGFDKSKASDLPAEGMAVVRPYLLKLMRIQYATAAASPELIIQELDTFPEVEAAFEASLITLGMDAQTAEMDKTKDTERTLALQKLTVLAEVGLLKEFEEGTRQLLLEEKDALVSAGILMSGFRAACRQNRLDAAEVYLRRAREQMARKDAGTDPVLEYAARTAEYQLRRLKGFTPDQSQIAQEFDKAWAAMKDYRPLTIVHHEANWYYGRMATRYWMDQLSGFPETSLNKGLTILQQMVAWIAEIETSGGIERLNLDGDDGLLHPDEAFGAIVLMVSLADQLSYVIETVPAIMELEGMLPMIGQLESMTDIFVSIQDDLGLTKQGPGFPPYDIRQGGIIPELRARCRYLEGISKDSDPAQRATKFDQAIALAKQTKNPEVTVDYLLKAGRALSSLGQHDQALAAWKEALAIADELSFVHRSLEAASLLAKEFGRREDWTNASVYAERASDKIQMAAPLLGLDSEESSRMAAQSQELTELSVKAAVETEDPEKALAALTRSQQVESAAVQMEGNKAAQTEVRDVLAKEEQVVALAQEVKRLEAMPQSTTRNSLLESTQGLLADTRAEFLSQSRGLRQKYSELYSKVLRFDPLNLPEIQKSLPADLAVVQYFPTDDALYIFLVTQKDFRLRKVPVGQKELESSALAYVRAVRRPGSGNGAMKAESEKLYAALVAPVANDIANCKTLVLIPSGRLNSLPFASLTGPSGPPLGEEKQILELAKSTDLMRMTGDAPKPVSSLVAFANATGDLPAAHKEGEQIAALFDQKEVKLFTGKAATTEAFLQFGSKADALHLATHGEWDTENSLRNFLAMADKQTVSQDQIFELGLDETSIVILSACNTAMGEGGGEVKYVASLAEAFWIAGSRSVVASLWAVNDESTSLLMTEFYKALKNGDGKAAALQKAQMAVRSRDEFAHPYFWAGFILFGDWR